MDGSLVTLEQVCYQYPNGTRALEDINLKIPTGKKIALLGNNGAGKSTLMLLLNGILKPTAGNLKYQSSSSYQYNKKALKELRKKVGLIFQDSDNQLIAPSVYEEISFGLSNLSSDKDKIRKKVDETIYEFCLQKIADSSPHQLSAGQKKRVCLAAILAMQPELIVCDEPSSNLDLKHTNITFKILDKLNDEGRTILISTHDIDRAYSWADYVILMKDGKILNAGDNSDVMTNQTYLEGAGLRLPFIVETTLALFPELKPDEFPKNIQQLKNKITQITCKDLY